MSSHDNVSFVLMNILWKRFSSKFSSTWYIMKICGILNKEIFRFKWILYLCICHAFESLQLFLKNNSGHTRDAFNK